MDRSSQEQISDPLTMRELATVLVTHYGLHEGKYDLTIEFQIGIGAVGPSPDLTLPGAIIGVSKIGLTRSKGNGPMTIDAAAVNPLVPLARPKRGRARARGPAAKAKA